jgi:hypothetical protein
MMACAWPTRARFRCAPEGDIDVNTVPNPDQATAIAATGQTGAAAAARIKLSPQGFCIDHPDP